MLPDVTGCCRASKVGEVLVTQTVRDMLGPHAEKYTFEPRTVVAEDGVLEHFNVSFTGLQDSVPFASPPG